MNAYVIGSCFVVWILVSIWGLANIFRFVRLFSFKSVEATVTSTGEHRETWDGDTTTYYHFSYRFTVNGSPFSGCSADSFIGSYGGMQKGEKQKGSPVTVFYNPKNPKENYSSRDGFYGGLFLTAFAQLFLLLGIHTYHNLS